MILPKIELMHGDCLELMKNIKDKSIDMILCDLPYGSTWNNWDKQINFNKLWMEYNRVINYKNAIVLFAVQPFTSMLVMSNISMYRCSYIWVKDGVTNFANARCQPMRKTEDIIVFSKAGMCPSAKIKCTYNPQGIKPYNKIGSRGSVGTNYANTLKTSNWQKFTNYPDNILYFSRDTDRLHPTQKPVALLEYLIKTYTNEGDTVLDNCMGSGSTGVACKNLNRNFIGIEKEKKYYDIAESRINNARII